jgi:K+-transporting ATPase ATPase C chain
MDLTRQLRSAIVAILFFTVLTGLAYPLAMTGVAQILFPDQSNGSLLRDNGGRVVGSRLIGQAFAGEQYFHSRPSAAGDGYDASVSSGSNLGPTSADLVTSVEERAAVYRTTNGLPGDALVPVDAVTASASGLDPHISIANALLQATRVAAARQISLEDVHALINEHTEGRGLGVLGEPGVNVLELNLGLDEIAPVDAAS